MTITVEIDAKQLMQIIATASASLQDFAAPLGVSGQFLKLSTNDRYLMEIDPLGKKWQANSPSTINAYMRKHAGRISMLKQHARESGVSRSAFKSVGVKKILRDSGEMQDNMTYTINRNVMVFGTSPKTAAYAADQQYGSTKRKIPARPFLGITRDDKKYIQDVFTQYIQKALTK